MDELLRLFAERGPHQQLWIVDACRDVPYDRRPRGYEIDWPKQEPQAARAQAAIFAVAQGGTALSFGGGQGRFTTHLLRGLAGNGCSVDYVPGRGYCVTAQSLHAYAKRRVLEALDGYDDWTRTVQTPEFVPPRVELEPLRDLKPPASCPLTVVIRPKEAETAVKLSLEVQMGIPVAGWPPKAPPRIYELRAELLPGMDALGWGSPEPALRAVDTREESMAVVDIPDESGQ